MTAATRRTPTLLLTALVGLALGATACTKKSEEGPAAAAEAASKGKVKLVYVNWAEGVAMTHLAKVVLEDRLNYEVETTMADVAPVFTALASGDSDAFLDGWLPTTHQSYLERFKDKVVDLGANYEGAKIGLVVPDYVAIDSIEQLNGLKEELEGNIVGIDSGAGIMTTTEKAIEQYGLQLKLVPSSGPAMTAALKDAIARKQPVVVTGWKPHWKFARWNLKFLADPKGVYGGAETIHTIARLGLEKDKPEVARFLRSFKLDDQQLGTLMDAVGNAKGSADDAAREWVKQNQALVDGWVSQKS